MMSHQIEILSKKTEVVKCNRVEILELKITTTEIKKIH